MALAPMALDSLDLARWQFGITTVYHFILVPLTIGLSPLVALMETQWIRTRNEQWLRATKFFGRLLLINFALGAATGIVQEFQFGMNWSEYSRFVGNVFGAPLAFEALLAFFLESTFLGLWIFGWDRLSPKLHNLCMWMVGIGTNVSAFFILAANTWMQHPVGAVINPATGRAELDGVGGFFAILTSELLITTLLHVIGTSFLVAGTMIFGVSVWWMVKASAAKQEYEARDLWRRMTRFGGVVVIVSGLLTAATGHAQGQVVVKEQPAKMAAAEMLCESQEGAGFTVAAFGKCEDGTAQHIITIPGVYSFMATNDFNAKMMGLKEAQAMYEERYGAGQDYTPDEMVTFWSFRLMIGVGMISVLVGAVGLWLIRKNRLITSPLFGRLGLWILPLPFIGASFGWIFTEIGRQPWVVAPNLADPVSQVYMRTADGVSTVVSSTTVLTSMVLFTVLYAVLGVIWFMLLRRYIREGVRTPVAASDSAAGETENQALSFEY
ncbi:cytochrome ubiquinol oxidase subunit I [Actinomyces weissii]|uniref:Cytochrome ubiquinol oxidase subunit I n=1 Tax=Actinomyces weissii TaxID=675090 RepID=A0A7T7S1U0_9ACTO|nr:cytochrome ubiquinol oxidase subunit I [Actinomyces weissii]QQM66734.1 cytochrome ubiquinol oxidase subunit I [Actinomyces weissii]